MSENMRIHFKNVLAGVGTVAILTVALMIAIPNFANYDLGTTGTDSSLYTDSTQTDGDVAESPDGTWNPCAVGSRVCIIKKYVDPNVPPYDPGAFDFKLTQGSKIINFSLKPGEFYGIDNGAGLVKWHRDDTKKQNVEDAFDDFSITETTQPSNIKTSYSCHRGHWNGDNWFAELDKSSGTPPYPPKYITGNTNIADLTAKRIEHGFINPETGRPYEIDPFYSFLCEFTNTLITTPVGNTADLSITKEYVPGQSKKVFYFNVLGKNSNGKVWNSQDARLNDDGVGDYDPKSQYPKIAKFVMQIKDNLGLPLNYTITETPDDTVKTTYVCKITVPVGYRPKPDIKGTGNTLNIVPGAGESIDCIFTNTKKGYIPVYDKADPLDPGIGGTGTIVEDDLAPW